MIETKPHSQSALNVFTIAFLSFAIAACNGELESDSHSIKEVLRKIAQTCNLPSNSPVTAYLLLNTTERRRMNSNDSGETASIQHQFRIGDSAIIEIDALVSGSETTLATATKTVTSERLDFSADDFTLTDMNGNDADDCTEYVATTDGSLSWPGFVTGPVPDIKFLWAIEVGGDQLFGTPVITDGNLIVTASGPSTGSTEEPSAGQLEAFSFDNINQNWPRFNNTHPYLAHQEVTMDQNGNFHLLRLEQTSEVVNLFSYDGNGNQIGLPHQGGSGSLRSGASIDPQGRAVFAHSPSEIAVRGFDGNVSIIGDIDLGAITAGKPAISNSGISYFTKPNGSGIVSVDLQSRESLTTCPANESFSSPAIDSRGNVIFGAQDGRVYACTAQMDLVWDYPTNSSLEEPVVTSPVVDGSDNVYLRSNNGVIYKLNNQGIEIGRYYTGLPSDGFRQGTPLITNRGYLIVVHEDGVQVIDSGSMVPVRGFGVSDLANVAEQSRSQFSFEMTKRSDLTMTPSEILVFRAENYLVAIQLTNTGGLAETGWPKWGADLRNSGLQR